MSDGACCIRMSYTHVARPHDPERTGNDPRPCSVAAAAPGGVLRLIGATAHREHALVTERGTPNRLVHALPHAAVGLGSSTNGVDSLAPRVCTQPSMCAHAYTRTRARTHTRNACVCVRGERSKLKTALVKVCEVQQPDLMEGPREIVRSLLTRYRRA